MLYTKDNPLRVVTLCSGYDSQCLALERLKKQHPGFDYELVAWAEIDKYAIQAHNAIFPQWADRNLGDMSKIDWSKVPDFDLLTYSTPCFTEGAIVLTLNGPKRICDVNVGDYVFTHTRTFKPVVAKFAKVYYGDVMGIGGVSMQYVTTNHPYLTRNNSEYNSGEEEWLPIGSVTKKHYVYDAVSNIWVSSQNLIHHKQVINSIVYNLEVDIDHSYCVKHGFYYLAVHNCQDFSNAGKQAGGTEGTGTRSSLLWFTRNAVITKRPKYLMMENVKALVSEKFLPTFNKWEQELAGYGYQNFRKVMNAKDYGVPQNRERIFCISILAEEDVHFHFPEEFPLTRRLKDVLEKKVAEKYYLDDEKVAKFVEHCDKKQAEGCGFKFEPSTPPTTE